MALTNSNANRLVADMGGTNTRLALFDPLANELRSLSHYINRDYAQPEDIIGAWLNALRHPRPTARCMPDAAPPLVHRANMPPID